LFAGALDLVGLETRALGADNSRRVNYTGGEPVRPAGNGRNVNASDQIRRRLE